MKTMLITGGAGFIGSFLVKNFLADYKIICIVRPSTNLSRLDTVKHKVKFIYHDIQNSYADLLEDLKSVDIILHAGANPSSESSIKNPVSVVLDNVLGTTHLLELARQISVERFVYYSAAEVFGPVQVGTDSSEDDGYWSNSPYAASKAGGEEMCLAYANTFSIPVSIIHITNTFGETCQSNRFPVVALKKILQDEVLKLHVDSAGLIGGRKWFYAGDVADHTRFILAYQQTACEKWNSAGKNFINNLYFAENIAQILNKKLQYDLIPIDRPGHDLYFSVTAQKLYDLGWAESRSFSERLEQTVLWYLKNQQWL